jgi:hypothetical protein
MAFRGFVEQEIIETCRQQMWWYFATEGKDTEGKKKNTKVSS